MIHGIIRLLRLVAQVKWKERFITPVQFAEKTREKWCQVMVECISGSERKHFFVNSPEIESCESTLEGN